MSSEDQTISILLFPMMAPGHMLPMVDTAKLFSSRGLKPAILTTPANVHLIQPSIDHANQSGHRHTIQLLTVPFPPTDGLPDGCENLASLTEDLHVQFYAALAGLRQPFDAVLRELHPDCLVSDVFLPWTADVAAKHGLPRIVFHGMSFFSQCAQHSAQVHKLPGSLAPHKDSFALPGLPHRIELRRAAMPDIQQQFGTVMLDIFQQTKEAESKSFGTVMNSFYELEPGYADYFRTVMGMRAWSIGPLSLRNEDAVDKSRRGVDGDACSKWLDSKEPRSVVYVCFGSLSNFSAAQLREIEAGLAATGRPFVWVVRKGGEEWMQEGKGLIIRGWAPQITILNHEAVGGFLTHCGWNSILEGLAAGLPLVTWPLLNDQFFNERLVVDVLQTGIAVGSDEYVLKPSERKIVEAARIEATISELMSQGEAAEERRRRARELGELALRAVQNGGSSYSDLSSLIAELREMKMAL